MKIEPSVRRLMRTYALIAAANIACTHSMTSMVEPMVEGRNLTISANNRNCNELYRMVSIRVRECKRFGRVNYGLEEGQLHALIDDGFGTSISTVRIPPHLRVLTWSANEHEAAILSESCDTQNPFRLYRIFPFRNEGVRSYAIGYRGEREKLHLEYMQIVDHETGIEVWPLSRNNGQRGVVRILFPEYSEPSNFIATFRENASSNDHFGL